MSRSPAATLDPEVNSKMEDIFWIWWCQKESGSLGALWNCLLQKPFLQGKKIFGFWTHCISNLYYLQWSTIPKWSRRKMMNSRLDFLFINTKQILFTALLWMNQILKINMEQKLRKHIQKEKHPQVILSNGMLFTQIPTLFWLFCPSSSYPRPQPQDG